MFAQRVGLGRANYKRPYKSVEAVEKGRSQKTIVFCVKSICCLMVKAIQILRVDAF